MLSSHYHCHCSLLSHCSLLHHYFTPTPSPHPHYPPPGHTHSPPHPGRCAGVRACWRGGARPGHYAFAAADTLNERGALVASLGPRRCRQHSTLLTSPRTRAADHDPRLARGGSPPSFLLSHVPLPTTLPPAQHLHLFLLFPHPSLVPLPATHPNHDRPPLPSPLPSLQTDHPTHTRPSALASLPPSLHTHYSLLLPPLPMTLPTLTPPHCTPCSLSPLSLPLLPPHTLPSLSL